MTSKYLFFDIECIQVEGKDYMFSFGYVICDESFNIITQEDILINPGMNFLVSTGIKIYYPWSKIVTQPTFYQTYEKLKEILEHPDYIIIGHAMENDIKFLQQECKSYQLPGFDFQYVDSQILYDDFHNSAQRSSIAKILSYYQITPTILHRSDMDAYYNMVYVQSMCKEQKIDISTLVNQPFIIKGSSKGLSLQKCVLKQWIYKETRTENKVALFDMIDLKPFKKKGGVLEGKTIAINTKLLYDNIDIGLYIITTLLTHSGEWQQANHQPDIFIYEDNDCKRQMKLQTSTDWNGVFLSLKELFQMIGVEKIDIKKDSFEYYLNILKNTNFYQ